MQDTDQNDAALAIAKRLNPALAAQANHTGEFLSPAIRYQAKQKLTELALQITATLELF